MQRHLRRPIALLLLVITFPKEEEKEEIHKDAIGKGIIIITRVVVVPVVHTQVKRDDLAVMVPRLFRILPRSTGRWNFFFSFARQHYRPTMILLSLSIRVFFIFVRRRSYTYYASFIYLEDAGRPQAPPLPPSLPLSVFFFYYLVCFFLFLLHHHHHHLATGVCARNKSRHTHIPVARLWAEMKLYYSTR